jgi:hypothetical protein
MKCGGSLRSEDGRTGMDKGGDWATLDYLAADYHVCAKSSFLYDTINGKAEQKEECDGRNSFSFENTWPMPVVGVLGTCSIAWA